MRWGRWYVFGAQAVTIYGVPRLSADVDVTIALTPDTPDRFADDMSRAGGLAIGGPDDAPAPPPRRRPRRPHDDRARPRPPSW